jgi:hypothetical protein
VRCMPGVCLSVWPTDACAWSIAEIWRWSDLVLRAIYFSLALMLVYTLYVVMRFFRRYRIASRELGHFESESSPEFLRSARTVAADLSRGLGTLRAIATTAPFLGLAGTCYGILGSFHSVGGSRASVLAQIVGMFAEAPITTLAGILVAIPAAFFFSLLRTRVETLSGLWLPSRDRHENDLGSFDFAQTLPLRKRFSGPPQFALLAAPFLALVVTVFMAFKPYPTPRGLPVRLLPMGQLDGLHTWADPITVSVVLRPHGEPAIRVNSEEIPSDQLEAIVSQNLQRLGHCHACVEGDSSVPWGYVTDLIDRIKGLHCQVILLTSTPASKGKRRPSRR